MRFKSFVEARSAWEDQEDSLLAQVIEKFIIDPDADRKAGSVSRRRPILLGRKSVLVEIKRRIETYGMYDFAKRLGVLRNNSAEDFSIEFMTAYNDEVHPGTY